MFFIYKTFFSDGERINGEVFSVGSGSIYAYGVLDQGYRYRILYMPTEYWINDTGIGIYICLRSTRSRIHVYCILYRVLYMPTKY